MIPPEVHRQRKHGQIGPDGLLWASVAVSLALCYEGRSVRGIARELAKEGIFARGGRPFAPSTILGLLRRAAGFP